MFFIQVVHGRSGHHLDEEHSRWCWWRKFDTTANVFGLPPTQFTLHDATRRDAMRDFCWLGASNAALHYPTLHYVMLHYITLRRLAPHHTHPFNGPLSRTTWVSRYHRGKTNLNFTEVSWTCPDMWAYGGVHSMLSDLSWRRVWSLLELSQLSMCTE